MKRFRWALDKGRISKMRKSADTLVTFNGGATLSQEYVATVWNKVHESGAFPEVSIDRNRPMASAQDQFKFCLGRMKAAWKTEHEMVVKVFPITFADTVSNPQNH